MVSSAKVSKLVEGLDVTVAPRGKLLIRAMVTREALEAYWHLTHADADSMLLAFQTNQEAIEAAILERYAVQGKEPVVVHAASTPPA
jgi:hypothetical protein